MALKIRRVVTGHDAQGKAKVLFDEVMTSPQNNRPGADFYNIWTTEGFPVNNDASDDASKRPVKTALPGGIVFRIVSFGPGVAPRNHRTDTIDFAVVISGEIEMRLDIGSVHLKAGDVLVQRGTIHDWVNKGSEPCVIAFTLVDAKPVEAGGQTLQAHG
ncbi:MAG: cupin domain-containing protein [Pseudolabrys sp.]